MNSLLSHKSRRYGFWTRVRFQQELGLSNFIAFTERNAAALEEAPNSRQDDFDIWLGTDTIGSWIASQRHDGVSNVLYLDGHAASVRWADLVLGIYPGGGVLSADGTYPN